MLGEFEFLLLAAAVRLGDGAYGAAIVQEIEKLTSRKCSVGALYPTLDRLEVKGLVKTRMGPPTKERGGRAKRMIEVTPSGKKAAANFYETVKAISHGTSWEVIRCGEYQ